MDGWNWKELKDRCSKLTLFKCWILNCKSDERWEVISEEVQNWYHNELIDTFYF
jgi:hypothetical protein